MSLSVASYCVSCGAIAAPEARYCQACGRPLAAASVTRRLDRTMPAILDAQAVEEEESAPAQSAPVESAPPALVTRLEAQPPAPLPQRATGLAAVPHLAAVAWRQPAVRSAVTTSAGAVALSLAWRLAGSALAARRGPQAALINGLTPMIGDLAREAGPRRLHRRRTRRGRVMEEVLYIRRTVAR